MSDMAFGTFFDLILSGEVLMYQNCSLFLCHRKALIKKMKYRDEKEKCYGVVGMAIALNVWDADDMYSDITIDAQGFDCINFTYDYFFSGSEAISPRVTLDHALKVFKVTMGLTISNLLCRTIVGDRAQVKPDDKKQLFDIFSEQARNDFSLTDDECRTIFDKSYNYLLRLYSHGEVRRMVADFATALQKRRRMSEHEVAEMLAIFNQ